MVFSLASCRIFWYLHLIWRFLKWGTPESSIYRWIFHYKPCILGISHLWKPSFEKPCWKRYTMFAWLHAELRHRELACALPGPEGYLQQIFRNIPLEVNFLNVKIIYKYL
jgi:hypothetical protein